MRIRRTPSTELTRREIESPAVNMASRGHGSKSVDALATSRPNHDGRWRAPGRLSRSDRTEADCVTEVIAMLTMYE
ncbi:hypothetical protein E4U53_003798 [Claviceps sorghi]|nr:hypothetical protein E4U53_003798 [Claviceps sorghi]